MKKHSTDKKVRFATIGSNFIVDSFLRGAFHDRRFVYAAVYSRTKERGEEFAAKYGVKKVHTSLEELALDPEIDAVYIASPNVCHAGQAVLMMSHGKHIICEKPLAPSYEEVKTMTDAARRYGVTLLEAMKTTLLPNFSAVREALPRIGKVRRFTAQFCQYSSRYDRFRAGEVLNAFDPSMKGGALLDLGVYGIAPLVHLFGMPLRVQSSSTTITPTEGQHYTKPSSPATDEPKLHCGIDGQGTLLLTYREMEGIIFYSKISDSTLPTEIQGEEGRILIGKLSQMTEPRIIFRDGHVEDISVPTIEDNMYYEVREFIDLIYSGRIESTENTLERSLQVIKIAEAAKFA